MRLKEQLKKFINIMDQKTLSSYLKSLEWFAIVEPVLEEELSEEEWEEIQKLLDELDD